MNSLQCIRKMWIDKYKEKRLTCNTMDMLNLNITKYKCINRILKILKLTSSTFDYIKNTLSGKVKMWISSSETGLDISR